MEETRLRILALLQRASQTTVEELAQALGMAPPSVRRHLDILQRDRLVAYRVMRRKPGRPEHAFYLTDVGHEALPMRYRQLLGRVVEALTASEGPTRTSNGSQAEQLFTQIAYQMLEPYRHRLANGTLAQRLAVLQEVLEAEGFAPALEEGSHQVRIHLETCPFRGVAMDHPSVCLLDQTLMCVALGVETKAEQRINEKHRHHHRCTYTLLPPD